MMDLSKICFFFLVYCGNVVILQAVGRGHGMKKVHYQDVRGGLRHVPSSDNIKQSDHGRSKRK